MNKINKTNEEEKRAILPPYKLAMANKQCLDVIIERVDNILKLQQLNHDENKADHLGIIERQDHTNGSVSDLQKKTEYNRGRLNAFAVAVTFIILPLFVFVLKDYFSRRDEILLQKQQYDSILKQIEGEKISIDKRIRERIEENNNKFFEYKN
jgi:hypothetical protein